MQNQKKSWHPHTFKNQERVWKAEQNEAAEKRKLAELQAEIHAERDREDLRRVGQASGVIAGDDGRKLEWMYRGPKENLNREDYLLGKSVDKTFEQLAEEEREKEKQNHLGVSVPKNHVEYECVPFSIRSYKNADPTSVQVDMARKIAEDPLMMIKQREMESRKKLLENPVKLKELKQLLQSETKKKSGKSKKESKKKSKKESKKSAKKSKKKKKKRSKSESSSSSSDSDSNSDVDDALLAMLSKQKAVAEEDVDVEDLNFDEMVELKYKTLTKELDKMIQSSDEEDPRNNKKRGDQERSKRRERSESRERDVRRSKGQGAERRREEPERRRDRRSPSDNRRNDDYRNNQKSRQRHSRDRSRSPLDRRQPDRRREEMRERSRERRKEKRRSLSRDRKRSDSPVNRRKVSDNRHRRSPSPRDSRRRRSPSRERKRSVSPDRKRMERVRSRRSPSNHTPPPQSSVRGRSKDRKRSATPEKRRSPDRPPNQRSSSSEDSSPRDKRRPEIDSDDEERFKKLAAKRNFGLVTASGETIAFKNSVKSYTERNAQKLKDAEKSTSSSSTWKKPSQRPRLTEEEKEQRLREMMKDAEWRDKERESYVRKYHEDGRQEEDKHRGEEFDRNFIHKELHKSAQSETVESRLKSNRNNIQRSSGAMNTNFARR